MKNRKKKKNKKNKKNIKGQLHSVYCDCDLAIHIFHTYMSRLPNFKPSQETLRLLLFTHCFQKNIESAFKLFLFLKNKNIELSYSVTHVLFNLCIHSTNLRIANQVLCVYLRLCDTHSKR